MDDDGWVDPDGLPIHVLWHQFLLFSPSYELARKDRAGTLTDDDRIRLPADFDTVLEVFDDLGDVQQYTFESWWRERGIRCFGFQGKRPRIGLVDVLHPQKPDLFATLTERTKEYLDEKWTDQGQQPSAVLAIPLGLTKEELMLQFEHVLTMYDDGLKVLNVGLPKYQLADRKRDVQSMIKYLKCLMIKCDARELKQWHIGAIAEVSSTYSGRLTESADAEDKMAISTLTSRALSRGLAIAENAARGVFPSYEKCKHAVAPDWEEMERMLNRHRELTKDEPEG